MKKLTIGVFLLSLAAFEPAAATAQSLGDQFQKLKNEVAAESWAGALSTLGALQTEAAKPGNEESLAKLEGPIAFYRGVCEANLGHDAEAVESFVTFLKIQPNSTIDAALHSKGTVAAFEKAQKQAAVAPSSIVEAYKEFRVPADAAQRDLVDAHWANGPVQWIISAEEKKTWSGLKEPNARVEFVERFWSGRATLPGADKRTYRQEFERRVAFADVYLAHDDEKRGSLTDRGMVFVLLGPPASSGRRSLRAGEDANEPSGLSRVGSQDEKLAVKGTASKTSAQKQLKSASYRGPEHKALAVDEELIEIWNYKSEHLPRGVAYQRVDVHYVTKKGYGKNVMQREDDAVNTLRAAAKQVAPAKATVTASAP